MREKSRNDCLLGLIDYRILKVGDCARYPCYHKSMPKVTLLPGGQSAEVPPDTLLLDAGEEAGVEMEAGCFNCSCGTCAVAIASGMENLEPPTDEELNVLDQWNKDPDKYRLTCCVKIKQGEVVLKLEH
jgi:ferredoxin